ncbi:hypothetical protein IE81DRAFT_312331 [Ceraceosorus guamensis]|uniref:CREG-like beta-barrel domain-containing protein n=1 Tax=Ceraceosorus guamensis TaxID=1522189 RepID=A0A316W187_9BASI|nr:hypothetical protein IE81DRAFT_312331 [Ceraceosorus guamensis]PWN43264.1 hypothetical protein IE81DRAFT_312331 [Ceraceosorus guamensis]
MHLSSSHILASIFLIIASYPIRASSASASTTRETASQAIQQARNLLVDQSTFGVATLSTVYASDYEPKELAGRALSGPEYFAPCYDNGDLLFLALPVSQNWRNVLNTPARRGTLSIEPSADPTDPDPRFETSRGTWQPSRSSWRKGMPSKQRLTLFGTMQDVPSSQIPSSQKCFTHHHPDASHWVPGSDSPHLAKFVRFEVQRVYRVGGFGDESWIGWIDAEQWRRTRPETESDQDAWNIDRNWVREGTGSDDDVSKSHSNDESHTSAVRDYAALFGDTRRDDHPPALGAFRIQGGRA